MTHVRGGTQQQSTAKDRLSSLFDRFLHGIRKKQTQCLCSVQEGFKKRFLHLARQPATSSQISYVCCWGYRSLLVACGSRWFLEIFFAAHEASCSLKSQRATFGFMAGLGYVPQVFTEYSVGVYDSHSVLRTCSHALHINTQYTICMLRLYSVLRRHQRSLVEHLSNPPVNGPYERLVVVGPLPCRAELLLLKTYNAGLPCKLAQLTP